MMTREMHSVRLQVFSMGRFQQLLLFGLFMMTASIQASTTQNETAAGSGDVVMGKVEYELPHELGVLSMQLPLHWVGGRADRVEALWIDQNGKPFKDNVTLTIRDGNKVEYPEEFLDRAIVATISSVDPSTVSNREKIPTRRLISFQRTIGGQEIMQTRLFIYTELADKSYLLMLDHSRLLDGVPVDLSQVRIK